MMRATRTLCSSFKPLNKQVLVRRKVPEQQTSAGIMIPQAAQQKANEALIVAVAGETKDWSPSVAVGDSVLLREWGGQVVKIDGEELTLMREEDILGVISA
ncbi:10 kDa chaperonin [Diplonema papillatum]|nr:10 kDa chaperonin [Diplonema papillatum]|eukprot:gene20687-31878_t